MSLCSVFPSFLSIPLANFANPIATTHTMSYIAL
jgi:hypothetical protein